MKHNFVCQEDLDPKIWGIGLGDHYQKKCGMFFETSYLLLSESNASSTYLIRPNFDFPKLDNYFSIFSRLRKIHDDSNANKSGILVKNVWDELYPRAASNLSSKGGGDGGIQGAIKLNPYRLFI